MLKRLLCISFCVILLAACSQQEPSDKPIRAIQYAEVSNSASGQVRRLSGIVQSSQQADLSFEISGHVVQVLVKLGDKVKAGQLLATLDPKPYTLALNSAQAELTKTQAQLLEKESDYKAKAQLYDKRFVAKTVLDAAKADFETASQNVASAQAKLELAQRDLSHTELKAPFDGEIAKRMIDPAMNIVAGQTLFQLLGQGGLEIDVAVPESLRRMMTVNMPVIAVFPTLSGVKTEGYVSEIAASANELNAFPSKIVITPIEGIYPGLTAEVIFNYQPKGNPVILLVPATALLPGPDDHSAYVFVFDPKTSTVHRRMVTAQHMQRNQVEISAGLSLGEIVATAGVHFLYDGQPVTLYKEP